MEADLRRLIETIRNPDLRAAARRTVRRGLRDVAALPHGSGGEVLPPGLPARAARAHAFGGPGRERVSASFPGIDRDLAVTGALIHDIGKIEAYASDPTAIDLTDDGRLLGEIPLGYYIVRSRSSASTAFRRAWHAPCCTSSSRITARSRTAARSRPARARPRSCTRSTTSAASSGSFDRLEKGLQDGETWSRFDRAIEGSAWFPAVGEVPVPVETLEQSLPAAAGE